MGSKKSGRKPYKLTAEQKQDILDVLREGVTAYEIAKHYPVSFQRIYQLKRENNIL